MILWYFTGRVHCRNSSGDIAISIFYWWHGNIYIQLVIILQYKKIITPREHSWLSFSKVHVWVPRRRVCLDALEVARKSHFSVLVASHWERSLLYLIIGGNKLGFEDALFAWLLLKSIHSNQQRNQRSLSGIWSLKEELVLPWEGNNFEKPRWMKIPKRESLQAPLSWRTKSFLILQAAHSRSSSSTSLYVASITVPGIMITDNWSNVVWICLSVLQSSSGIHQILVQMGGAPVRHGHPQGVYCHSTLKLSPVRLPVLLVIVKHQHDFNGNHYKAKSYCCYLSHSIQKIVAEYVRYWKIHSCHWRNFASEPSSRLMNSPSVPLLLRVLQ